MFANQTQFAGTDDGALIRQLQALGCDWLVALDLHREPEVWTSVLTALAERTGRLIRIRPWRRKVSADAQIAWLSRFIVDGYEEWSKHLENPRIRMIELGRAWALDKNSVPRPRHGFTVYQAYNSAEVGELLQAMMGGPTGSLMPVPPRRIIQTVEGRRHPGRPQTNHLRSS